MEALSGTIPYIIDWQQKESEQWNLG